MYVLLDNSKVFMVIPDGCHAWQDDRLGNVTFEIPAKTGTKTIYFLPVSNPRVNVRIARLRLSSFN